MCTLLFSQAVYMLFIIIILLSYSLKTVSLFADSQTECIYLTIYIDIDLGHGFLYEMFVLLLYNN